MIEMESNHCRIVTESLNSQRDVNEQTFVSLGILAERLEHLRQLDGAFACVSLSPAAQELMSREDALHYA